MATFQSQINILAKAIINLHNNINDQTTNQPFKIMKFNYYDENGETLKDVKDFRGKNTYGIGLTFNPSKITVEDYNVNLRTYQSQITNENKDEQISFEYQLPYKYTKNESRLNIKNIMNELYYEQYKIDNENKDNVIWIKENDNSTPIQEATILFNFGQIIPTINEDGILANHKTTDVNGVEIPDEYATDETITIIPPTTRSQEETSRYVQTRHLNIDQAVIEKSLENIIQDNEKICIDLVNEKLESLLYTNIYQKNENELIRFKANQTSNIKKYLDLNNIDLKNKYILDCDNNKIYYFV